LLGILVVSLASLAWAGVPDLNNSSVVAANEPASVFAVPDGTGVGLDAAFAPGGATIDATITLTLVDTAGDPIFLYPFEDLWLETSGGSLVYCANGTAADGSTDEMGQTTWTNPVLGGSYSPGENTLVIVAGAPVSGGGVQITFNSADINGDLFVNLSDAVAFTQMYNGDFATHPLYAADFNNDGFLNLSDAVRMAGALGASCN
jgi:hypothetical protein